MFVTSSLNSEHIASQLYYTLFHSHLMYCLLVWGSACSSQLEAINVLQHKILKVYLQLPKRTHTNIVYKQAKILPLSDLFYISIAKLIHKFIHTPHTFPSTIVSLFQLASQVHSYSTRGSSNADLYMNPFAHRFGVTPLLILVHQCGIQSRIILGLELPFLSSKANLDSIY